MKARGQSILVAGCSGVVGSEVIAALRTRLDDVDVVGVSASGAGERSIQWRIGAEPAPDQIRSTSFDVIVNCVANTTWSLAPDVAWEANVTTAEALLELAGPSTRFVQVSTVFATGRSASTTSPDLDDYYNTYEWSKAAAERVVAERHANTAIVRVPLVIGARHDGHIIRFTGMYSVIRALFLGFAPGLVGDADHIIQVAPVDDIATILVSACTASEAPRSVVVGVGSDGMTVREMVTIGYDVVDDWRAARGAEPLVRAPVIPPSRWDRLFATFVAPELSPIQLRLIEVLDEFRPYASAERTITPDILIPGIRDAMTSAMTYWAECHPRVALGQPRPWRRVGDAG